MCDAPGTGSWTCEAGCTDDPEGWFDESGSSSLIYRTW
jgi:hypothetical protein